MHKPLLVGIAGALALAFLPVPGTGARAADLPKATQKALKELKLDAALLKGLDDELKVPQDWLDGAAKEKEVVILGTWDDRQFRAMTAAFKERYPFVNLNYTRTGTSGRGIKVLVALGEGRVIADVLTSIANATFQFIKMKALADLRDLPGYNNMSPEYVAPDGTWVSHKIAFRCMAYNTTKVNKKADLPKTWDDILSNPRWRNGNLAVSNHPNNWVLNLWGGKGEKWGNNFVRRLFEEVKPQRRKEGMSSTLNLTVAGEFDANIPASERRAQQLAEKGAPVGYHCPSPVPITVSQVVMLEKSPHKNGARLFINWILSREGQFLQYAESFAVPVHKALQSPRFLSFADTIVGKPVLVRDDALLGDEKHKHMLKLWNDYWTAPVAGK
jgi:iron(III) transport system substrate-binding protein